MFDLNLKGMSDSTVAIIAHNMVSDKVAKVVVSYTGKWNPNILAKSVSAQLKGLGSIVESSFKPLKIDGLGKLAVGYIKANREVRMPSAQELKANYKVLSSNVLRSNEDRSLWELKKGKNTTYLARKGNDDLSELVSLCTASCHPTSGVTTAVNANVQPQSYDFIQYVNAQGDLDYGFVTASEQGKAKVISCMYKQAEVIPTSAVVTSHEVKIDPILAKAVKRKLEADTKDGSYADMEAFYKALYSYDPEYMDLVLKQVRDSEQSLA